MKLPPEQNITPDCWVILEYPDPIHPGNPPHQKILSGWSGGYLDGDSWRLSSPIKKMDIKVNQDFYMVDTNSGSTYTLWKARQRFNTETLNLYNTLVEKIGNEVKVVTI